MSQDILLERILSELKSEKISPLSIHKGGTHTYIIYKAHVPESGYLIERVTEVTANHTYFGNAFLAESVRVSGDNGSSTNVNLKTDQANTLLLLTNLNFS